MRMLLQILAFFSPPPINVWIHRLASAKIGAHTVIHPGVMIIAKHVEIGSDVKIRFGTMVNVRSFSVGKKTLIGYFVSAKGMSDLKTGPACVVGPNTMINCDCPVTLGCYTGVGPRSTLFTHGSFLPVTEGYRVSFGPIDLKDRSWVTMNSTVGPGVTVGEGTNVMPGTVLLESVGPNRLVAGNPAKLVDIPFLRTSKTIDLELIARDILQRYRDWANSVDGSQWILENDVLQVKHKKAMLTVSINSGGDIALLTKSGERNNGMYFNLADLKTDAQRHPAKMRLEGFLRLYYGLTFL
jgi:acetyltransferase-like isoleucine patch superfamily enzyme